jgi:hypothetical protein
MPIREENLLDKIPSKSSTLPINMSNSIVSNLAPSSPNQNLPPQLIEQGQSLLVKNYRLFHTRSAEKLIKGNSLTTLEPLHGFEQRTWNPLTDGAVCENEP